MSAPKVAVIGLAVMGSNLARNIERNGYPIAVYNRTESVTKEFMDAYGVEGNFTPAYSLEDVVQKLDRPRQLILMIKAGSAVDTVIENLLPLLDKGDMILDGGNTYFTDTDRREAACKEKGISFLGVGISGGEEGALNGPSIMPGGPKEAWKIVAPMLEAISAKAPHPCTTYIGPGGAGHFVKMVHNGIEYGDMQLIAESYHLLSALAGLGNEELHSIYSEWNEGVLSSYLIEITSQIFTKDDDQDGDGKLVDAILDKAGQKGTGRWTAQVALDLGVAIPTISSAVDARILSSLKSERELASSHFAMPASTPKDPSLKAIVHDALYASKILSYAQGMALLQVASKEYDWNLPLSEIASIWEGGCIIRAQFLEDITRAFENNTELPNLMLDPFIKTELSRTVPGLRKVIGLAALSGIPTLSMAASLSYFDSYRLGRLPQNLTQAQRDYFGAHTFERTDMEGVFHADWEN